MADPPRTVRIYRAYYSLTGIYYEEKVGTLQVCFVDNRQSLLKIVSYESATCGCVCGINLQLVSSINFFVPELSEFLLYIYIHWICKDSDAIFICAIIIDEIMFGNKLQICLSVVECKN